MTVKLPFLRRWWQLVVLLLLSVLAVAPVSADPTGRVGRIAWLSGSVHLHRTDSGESSTALLNWPLTGGDILSTADGARAEVQIGSTSVQLDAGSVLEFVTVDDQRVHLRLLDGSVIARFRSRESAHEFELSTPDGSFSVNDAGSYRFDVNRSSTGATVAAGSLHFEASDSALDIRAGQHIEFWNDGRTRYHLSAPVTDDFVLWSAARDRLPGSASDARQGRYVSPEMTGATDLDAYGRWDQSTEYGALWFPRGVAADWAPYREGRWAWVAPWGWTWVGDEPWGFAPFHYGRWVIYRGAWAWVPGRPVARPVYAPALVAWIGTPAVSVSLQIGARPAVGWFPLAPREIYVPPYRSSVNHVRQVNVTQITRTTNVTAITSNPQAFVDRTHYAHRQLPRAVTMVPADVVTERRPVHQAAMRVEDGRLLGSQAVQMQAPLAVPPMSAGRRPAGEVRREQGGGPGGAGGPAVDGRVSGGGRRSQALSGEGAGSPTRSTVPAENLAQTAGAAAVGGSRGVVEQQPGRPIRDPELATVPRPGARAPANSTVASPLPSPTPAEQADRPGVRGGGPTMERPESRADRRPSGPARDDSGARAQNPALPAPAPRLPAEVGAQQGADRSAEAVSRSLPPPERREPRLAPPTTRPQSSAAGSQGFERPAVPVQPSPIAPQQSQGASERRPAPIPPSVTAPRMPDHPPAEVVRQPGPPGGERPDARIEQRPAERAPRREDASRQQMRHERQSNPVPPAAQVNSPPQAAPRSRPEQVQEGVRGADVRTEARAERRRSVEGAAGERKDSQ